MIVHLKTNNLSLCLSHEYLKSVLPKNILKKSQKTSYVLASVGKTFIKIEQWNNALKNCVLYEIYSKKLQ